MNRSFLSLKITFSIAIIGFFSSCTANKPTEEAASQDSVTVETTVGPLTLPPPYTTESEEKDSKVIGWPADKTPVAPAGFTITKYAGELENPRWSYFGPNGDLFVSESNTKSSADRITMFRDTDNDGMPDMRVVFLDDLNQPFGMLVLNNFFYVANTDGLYRFPYTVGDTLIDVEGEKLVDLPAGGYNHHWTRNIITNPDSTKIYISVGSASNVGEYGMEEEVRRANILEINPDGSGEKIYASGLRNPVGMDFSPENGVLWTAVNERDKLGDNLVPDYITSVKEGGFYGWPYSYYGQIVDPRREGEAPELVDKAIIPDVSTGPHTASLGFTFYDGEMFPQKYKNGAFIGQHGSWNRSKFSGYKIAFVPFENGTPTSAPEDFVTGFIANEEESEVYGRPVAVTVMPDGALLINDDSGNALWRVAAE